MGNTARAWTQSIELHRASKGLVAGLFFRKKRIFNDLLHPRGADGRFITKGGDVKWREKSRGGLWKRGTVTDIPGDGSLIVKDSKGVIYTKKPSDVINAPKAIAHLDPTGWTKTRGQQGSNPAAFFKDKNGDEWYVKDLATPDHVNSEVLGHRLYELAGAPVPDVTRSPDGRKFMTKIEESDDFHDLTPAEQDMAKKAARKHFVTDAWLANWDAPMNDNIRYNQDGEAMRIDTGGALNYRARGGLKGHLFGSTVGELKSLRDPSFNYAGYRLYDGLTPDEEKDNVERILAIHPNVIRDVVKAEGAPSHVADTLIQRREYLAKHYNMDLPEDTPEAKLDLQNKNAPAAPAAPSANTVSSKAMPLAVGAPAWVKKSDLQQGGGDRWTVKSISADQQSVTLQSVTQPGKTIDLNHDQYTLLRSNFTSAGHSYKSGEIPNDGDRVKVAPSRGKDITPYDATVIATYPAYVKVQKDNGEKRVVSQASTSLVKRSGENTSPDHALDASQDTADETLNETNKDALNALKSQKSAIPPKPVFPGEKFDFNGHDWKEDRHPRVYSELHERDARVVMVQRDSDGKIENIVVTTDNDLGGTDTVSPDRVYKHGSVTQAKIDQFKQDTIAWRKQAASSIDIDDIIEGDEERLSSFTRDELFDMLKDGLTPEDAKKIQVKPFDKTMLSGYDAGFDVQPGDRQFSATVMIGRDSDEPQILTFLQRDGKVYFAGANSEAVEKNPSFRSAVNRANAGVDNESIAYDLIQQISAHRFALGRTSATVTMDSLNNYVGEAAADVLGNAAKELEYDDWKKIRTTDGEVYELDKLAKTLDIKKTAHHYVNIKSFKPIKASEADGAPHIVAISSQLKNGDLRDGKVFIAGFDGETRPLDDWIELPEHVYKNLGISKQNHFAGNLNPYAGTSRSSSTGADIPLQTRAGEDVSVPDTVLYDSTLSDSMASKLQSLRGRAELRVHKGDLSQEKFDSDFADLQEAHEKLFTGARTWRDDGAEKKKEPLAPSTERIPGTVPAGYGQAYYKPNKGPEDVIDMQNPFSKEKFIAGEYDDDILAAVLQDFKTDGWYSNNVKTSGGQMHADPVMAYMQRLYDLDTNAIKLDPEQFDEYVKQHGQQELYRGIRGGKFVNDLRTGTNFAGYGVFGNGLYTSPNLNTALSYGGNTAESVTTLTERAGIKTLTSDKTEYELADAFKPLVEDYVDGLHAYDLAPSAEDLKLNSTFHPDVDNLPTYADALDSFGSDDTDELRKEFNARIDRLATTWMMQLPASKLPKDRHQEWAEQNPEEYREILDYAERAKVLRDYYTSKGRTITGIDLTRSKDGTTVYVKADGEVTEVFVKRSSILDDGMYTDIPDNTGKRTYRDRPMLFDFNEYGMDSKKVNTDSHNINRITSIHTMFASLSKSGSALDIASYLIHLKSRDSADGPDRDKLHRNARNIGAYFDRDGKIIRDQDSFEQRLEELKENLSASDFQTQYAHLSGDNFDGDFPQYIEEVLPAMRSYAKMLYAMDPGRAALIFGYDKIELSGFEDHRIFTHRGAMVMKRTW